MIIENTGLNGVKSELGHLDDVAAGLGFIRWQWENYRATYDCKFEDKQQGEEYFLRISTRAVEGKLEDPYAVLNIEDSYIGRATFPHGLDYASPIPEHIMKAAIQKLVDLKTKLN